MFDDTRLTNAIEAAEIAGAVALIGGRDGVRYESCWGVRAAGDPDRPIQRVAVVLRLRGAVTITLLQGRYATTRADGGMPWAERVEAMVLRYFAGDDPETASLR